MKKITRKDSSEFKIISNSSESEIVKNTTYEIELWKQKQLKLFEKEIQTKIKEYLESFEEEFYIREKQRQLAFENKLKAIDELEKKMINFLQTLEDRIYLLKEKEIIVQQKEDEIFNRYEKLDEEIALALNNMKINYDIESNNQIDFLESQKKELEKKINFLEEELAKKMLEIDKFESNNNPLHNSKTIKTHSNINCGTGKNIGSSLENKTSNLKISDKDEKLSIEYNEDLDENQDDVADLLQKIAKERDILIENGLSKDHPIIHEIDQCLN